MLPDDHLPILGPGALELVLLLDDLALEQIQINSLEHGIVDDTLDDICEGGVAEVVGVLEVAHHLNFIVITYCTEHLA